ncbi:MAG: hypothetical protein WD894_05585 [Pirellulales bacterium]
MFRWIRRLLPVSKEEKQRRFLEEVDAFNAQLYGGWPTVTRQFLGHLKLRSGTLVLGDPRDHPAVEVPNVPAPEVAISALFWSYPSGMERVISLTLRLADEPIGGSSRKIGDFDIDSKKLVVLDKADREEYWTDVGKDRIGVISTATEDAVLHMLTERFELKTVRVNPRRAEVVGPVSEVLDKEIEDYLKSNPKYADFPSDHFRVETNDSRDRACHLEKAWGFLPIGAEGGPLMFVCGTGRGDGVYDVHCTFNGDVPSILSIDFVEESVSGGSPS